MKYLLSIVFLLFVNFSFACECVAKPGINIKDLNDTDFIFTGILSQFEKVEGKIELTFQISNILKGRVNNKSIKFSIDKDKNHDDVFHHIDSIYKGQKWIIFSTIFQMNDKSIYKLKESNDTDYCMLSKPLVDNDSYLLFINETFKNSNNSIKTYTKKKVVFAKGSLKNKFPKTCKY